MANIEDKENLLVFALNDISCSISRAISPINDMTLPFVAAVLSQYTDILCQNMDHRTKIVYHDIKDLTSKQGKAIKIVLPRKDD